MRKWISLLLCLTVIVALAGCGNNNSSGRAGNQPAGVNDVLEVGMAEEDSKKAEAESQSTESEEGTSESRQNGVNENAPKPDPIDESEIAANSTEGIDVDLTALSSTMVYSEVYNMMVSPEEYIGKTVKMSGFFTAFYDEAVDKHYYACIIQDATACCAQGIEFELTEDYQYPEDYPGDYEEICVIGVFDTYQEGDYTYCTLRNAQLL